jgi:hypothetical protein
MRSFAQSRRAACQAVADQDPKQGHAVLGFFLSDPRLPQELGVHSSQPVNARDFDGVHETGRAFPTVC